MKAKDDHTFSLNNGLQFVSDLIAAGLTPVLPTASDEGTSLSSPATSAVTARQSE